MINTLFENYVILNSVTVLYKLVDFINYFCGPIVQKTLNTLIKTLPIEITDAAYEKIVEIKSNKSIDNSYLLRLGVKSAGCGVASHIIGFDRKNEKDELYKYREIEVIIEKVQLMYLAGKKIDYKEVDGETGFVFRDK